MSIFGFSNEVGKVDNCRYSGAFEVAVTLALWEVPAVDRRKFLAMLAGAAGASVVAPILNRELKALPDFDLRVLGTPGDSFYDFLMKKPPTLAHDQVYLCEDPNAKVTIMNLPMEGGRRWTCMSDDYRRAMEKIIDENEDMLGLELRRLRDGHRSIIG